MNAAVSDARAAAELIEQPEEPVPDAAAALQAIRARGVGPVATAPSSGVLRGIRFRRRTWRPILGSALVAVMGLGLMGTGVAGNLIKIFESETVVAVPVDPRTLNSLPDLSDYGTVDIIQMPEMTEAANLQDAAERTGLAVLSAELPSGVEGAELVTVVTEGRAAFTFDSGRAAAGPPELDGATLYVDAGPAVVQTFGGSPPGTTGVGPDRIPADRGDLEGLLSDLPELMIVHMKAPVLSSSGPSVSDFRAALLELPNLSEQLKEQIRGIGDPASTLPLPIPVDLASSREVEIGGVTGLVVGDNTGFGSAVVWQSGGVVRAVGGLLTEDEALATARSMG